ncbi:MAG TPA: hypothetical protein P5519_01680 [Spirochaetia bacterium]|nr:hypothetical protein [Spirochaetales bacterium]HRS64583.1 hypothetical protein [Spirochaetia bacterium]
MPSAWRHLYILFAAEILDIIEDIHILEESWESRFKNAEITNYVYMENESLLKHEEAGLKMIHQKLASFAPANIHTADDMAKALKEFIRTIVTDQDLPVVLIPLLERKIDKLKGYCEADETL